MDPVVIAGTVAAVIKICVDLGPTVIKGVEDARPFAEQILKLIHGDHVTQEQLDALRAGADALSSQIQAMRPPESTASGLE